MKISPFIRPGWKSAFWSLLLLAPALFLAIPGLTQSLTGSNQLYSSLHQSFSFGSFDFWNWLIHPAVVISGLMAALFLSVFSIMAISMDNNEQSLVTTIAVNKSLWNLVPLALALFFGLIIFLYLVAENFGPFF